MQTVGKMHIADFLSIYRVIPIYRVLMANKVIRVNRWANRSEILHSS